MKNEIQEVCKKFGKLIGNDIRDSWDLLKESNIISTLTDDIVYRVNNESNYYLLIDWITDSDVKRFISDLEAIIGIRGIKNDKVMVLINRNLALPESEIKFVSMSSKNQRFSSLSKTAKSQITFLFPSFALALYLTF